ncbi:hypothetical protein SERLA73DRAFT_178302, partial [Serpula lacrymans var. lacrymans S7.3]
MSSQPPPTQPVKPDTPPPAYTDYIPEESQPSGSGSSSTPPPPFSGAPSYFQSQSHRLAPGPPYPNPPLFGPTPLGQDQPTLGLLPYYDPRSPYAVAAAASRARWRFVGAALWAV